MILPRAATVAGLCALALAGTACTSSSVSGKPQNSGGTTGSATRMVPTSPSDIAGIVHKDEPNRMHVSGIVQYDTTPPTGGNHSQYWADCTGTVYPAPIANENAVHMLEHGAVWLTYREGLPAAQVAELAKNIEGNDYTAMSPFPGLRSTLSLQAWGYQLFLDSVTDPRIGEFINYFKANPKTTPEYGATCSQPTFKLNPSTFGHPKDGPS